MKRQTHVWTADEIEFLRQHAHDCSALLLAQILRLTKIQVVKAVSRYCADLIGIGAKVSACEGSPAVLNTEVPHAATPR